MNTNGEEHTFSCDGTTTWINKERTFVFIDQKSREVEFLKILFSECFVKFFLEKLFRVWSKEDLNML